MTPLEERLEPLEGGGPFQYGVVPRIAGYRDGTIRGAQELPPSGVSRRYGSDETEPREKPSVEPTGGPVKTSARRAQVSSDHGDGYPPSVCLCDELRPQITAAEHQDRRAERFEGVGHRIGLVEWDVVEVRRTEALWPTGEGRRRGGDDRREVRSGASETGDDWRGGLRFPDGCRVEPDQRVLGTCGAGPGGPPVGCTTPSLDTLRQLPRSQRQPMHYPRCHPVCD